VVSAGNIAAIGIVINRSAIVNNATNGLQTTASGQNGVIFVGNSTIAGNGTGINGGVIFTNGNNSVAGNFVGNGTFSGTVPLQ